MDTVLSLSTIIRCHLDEVNLEEGVNVRVDARVDFGVTSASLDFVLVGTANGQSY